MQTTIPNKLGAQWRGDGRAHFRVWAPGAQTIEVVLTQNGRIVPLVRGERGYYTGIVEGLSVGDTYLYQINGERRRPDPATRHQPQGVHGPSQIVDTDFAWTDTGFMPPTLRNSVFYELHVGTMTAQGTFRALIEHLPRLRELGITTLEIMPVAQCPGTRNWGYDGVQVYAPQNSYGTPDDFKALINAAHQHGLAVFLDVVYNHLGPEGNYLWDFGPYFTSKYKGAWGDSLNFDDRGSDEVRRYFIENAIYWLDEFHIDGLRLDATQTLIDLTAVPFIQDLTQQVNDWAQSHNRRVYLVAETNRSDRKHVLPREIGGDGLDGQWLDDFHHGVHTALTGEGYGYLADHNYFGQLAKVLRTRFANTGGYSGVAGRRHGTDASDIPADRYIAFTQNHDHVGNRMMGDRIMPRSGFEANKLATVYLFTSPYVPLLFMGQEYGEIAPFQFFTDFSDEGLIEAVRKGRKEEFSYFLTQQGDIPDPHDEATYLRSKLNHELRHEGEHALLYRLHQHMMTLRRDMPALTHPHPADTTAMMDSAGARVLVMERRGRGQVLRVIMNWSAEPAAAVWPDSERQWHKLLDTTAAAWHPDGVDHSTTPQTLEAGVHSLTLPAWSAAIYQW